MNAFFAHVEQTANPFIRYLPVAVGSVKYANSALVAVSYEAKRRGVKGLMRLREAREICPELLVVPFDPLKYYSINRQIMNLLRQYTPQMEIYSVDEAFLDLTENRDVLKGRAPRDVAQEIKDRITSEIGAKLTSSVGIAPNKLLAKVASDWKKPDGLTEISWEERLTYLDQLKLMDIWGIGYRSGEKLDTLGIKSTKQLREIDDMTLRGIVGSYYTRLKLIANGQHYDPVDPHRHDALQKSMQHAHTLSHATSDRGELKTVIRKMSERLARRLRKYDQTAQTVYLGLRPENQKHYGWGPGTGMGGMAPLQVTGGSDHGKDIYDAACEVFSQLNLSETRIRLVSVGINNLLSQQQMLLGAFTRPQIRSLNSAVDNINGTYGEFTIRSADILHQYAKESELSVERENMTFHPAPPQ